MHHAVRIINDNVPAIIKWLPTGQMREQFRDYMSYIDPDARTYYAVLYFTATGQASFMVVGQDVIDALDPEVKHVIV